MTHPHGPQSFEALLRRALDRRRALLSANAVDAYRAFAGSGDGIEGVYVDVYGVGAVLIVHEGRAPAGFGAPGAAAAVLSVLAERGVTAVYLKHFVRDRSKLGGELPPEATDPAPAAGAALPESLLVREHGWKLEVRLYDGLSTGLFLDQRDNRGWVSQWAKERARAGPTSVLNTFAYTCAFSVAAALSGAQTTSVDVSGRYLDWGKRNFAHNGLDAAAHRFAKMDTFEFLGYAKRKGLAYDLMVLDPPSFAAGSKRKGVRAWSSVADYARLVREAFGLLRKGGVIFASTNTQELCRGDGLQRQVVKGLGGTPKWIALPPPAADFAAERGRFAACAFRV